MFITLDGIDGSGKTTQASLLSESLVNLGLDVVHTRDPGSTIAGDVIRNLLLNSDTPLHRRSEAMLFMAARSELVEEVIIPSLRARKVVVSDRFLLANIAYQGCQNPQDQNFLKSTDLWLSGIWASAGLIPDLTLLLDLPAEIAIDRLTQPKDRFERRGKQYLEQVRLAFLDELPRSAKKTYVLDASLPSDEVHRTIASIVIPALGLT
jgi:dTMP kinase